MNTIAKQRKFTAFYISATTMNEDVTDVSTWGAVDWISVAKGVSLPRPTGFEDPIYRFLTNGSTGMDALNIACPVENNNSYGFKVVRLDGSIEYNRGFVVDSVEAVGRDIAPDSEYIFGWHQAPPVVPVS